MRAAFAPDVRQPAQHRILAFAVELQIPFLPDANADHAGIRTGRILESLPFIRFKTHFAVDKHFLGRPARFLGVRLDGQLAQRLGRRIAQMKISRLVVIPGTERSLENHSVPGIQKHLGRAAGVFRRAGGFILLEHQTDIAHAVADIRHFPGTPSYLVKDGRAEIPGDFRLARCGAGVKVAVGGLANI